ncbi:MAG: S8 family serine peptidase [bacterium]|nr:S8 family serine peptidase [bacterium]
MRNKYSQKKWRRCAVGGGLILLALLWLAVPLLAEGHRAHSRAKFDHTISRCLRHKNGTQKLSDYTLAQETAQRIPKRLKKRGGFSIFGYKVMAQEPSSPPLSLLITTDDRGKQLEELLREKGGFIGSKHGDVCTVLAYGEHLENIADLSSVKHIGASRPLDICLDGARQPDGVNLSESGQLSNREIYKDFTGRGVLIGVIDTGMDVQHAAFKDQEGKSRILAYWNQNESGEEITVSVPPLEEGGEWEKRTYNYGREYTKADIDAGAAPKGVQNHGTHVASIAGGSLAEYPGIAPEANFLLVDVAYSAGRGFAQNGLLDGIEYMIAKAKELDMPLVINMSLGGFDEFCDGTSLLDLALQADIESPVRNLIACISAGNDGRHLYPLQLDASAAVTLHHTPYSWYDDEAVEEGPGIIVVAPYDSGAAVTIETFTDAACTEKIATVVQEASLLNSGFLDKEQQFRVESCLYDANREDVDGSAATPATLYAEIVGNLSDEVYCRYTFHNCDTSGQTRISPYEYYSDSAGGLASFAAVNPCVGATLGTPGTTPGAITVGAYSDEDRGLCSFSSCGPPRVRSRYTGVNAYKPDICAPGYAITAALPSWASKAGVGSKSGTSMASPVVAGMAALILQHRPDLTAAQIKELLFDGARRDMCTGSAANDRWGHGKLDAGSLPITANAILKVTACGDSAEYAYVYVANADDPEPVVTVNGQRCADCAYEPSADTLNAKAIKVGVDPALGAYLSGASPSLSRDYSFVYQGEGGSTSAYTLRKTFAISSVRYDYSSVYVRLSDTSITEGSLYVNGHPYGISYFDWNRSFCIITELPKELASYIAGYTDTLSQDYQLQFVAGDGRQSEVRTFAGQLPAEEVEQPQIVKVSADSSRFDSCVYVYTNGYCGPCVYLNGAACVYASYSNSKQAYRVTVPGELYRYIVKEDGALSQDYIITLRSSQGNSASKAYEAVRDLRPIITKVTSSFSQAAVSIKDCVGRGDDAGQAALKLNGKVLSDAYYYSTGYGASFEAQVPTELYNYLNSGQVPQQTYRFEVVSDAGLSSAPWIIVGSVKADYIIDGFEIEENTGAIVIRGRGFTAAKEVVLQGKSYAVEFISDTQVRIKDVPAEIIDTILIGQDKGAGIIYALTVKMAGGSSASYEIVPKEKLLITEVGSADGEGLTLTLSDENITSDGSCFINGREYDAWYQPASGKFAVYSHDCAELASYCQNWTDTLSQDYTLKFVCADGRESLEETYQKTLPEAVDVPSLEDVLPDTDSQFCHVAYVKTSGFGGTLKINGETPRYALYSSAKQAYRVAVPHELGRYLQNKDGALSRDYEFTLSSEGNTEVSRFTVKAMRSLQPNIVSVLPAYRDENTAYADVFVRNCPGCGDEAGRAMVQLNGEMPAEHIYCPEASCAYFRISIPFELYAYLSGENSVLEREYCLTAISDAGIVSEEKIFASQADESASAARPVITGISAGATKAEAALSVGNFSGGSLYINGVYVNSAYDSATQTVTAQVDYALGAYLKGTSKTLAQSYVFRLKNASGAVSEPYTVHKVSLAKPVITGVTKYSSGSTSLAYLVVKDCKAGSVYMDGVKRSTCAYVSGKKAFKINVSSEVGRYLTKKSSVLPNAHTFKVVSADGVSSSVYTLKANTPKPVISKVGKYSASSTAYAYVYCSNCTAGSAIYINGTRRSSAYVASKKAFKVNIPTALGRYLTGKSKTLARSYSFKAVNKLGAISAVKTVAAVTDAPVITSAGKYLSTYIYLYVKNCPRSAKVYLNGKAASKAFVVSKNAFRVKVPKALGNYYLDKAKGLDKDYTFKVVSGTKSSKVFTVKKAAVTPNIVQIAVSGQNTAAVYVSGITTGGTVYIDGYAAAGGTKYDAASKAFVDVVIPEELAAFLRGESDTLSRSYKFKVKSSQGKTSAAKTISGIYPDADPVIAAILPDSENWLKLRVENCAVGSVYVNGTEVPSFCESGYFYACVDDELAAFVRGDSDTLRETYSIQAVRRDSRSSEAVSVSQNSRPAITRIAGDPEYRTWGRVYLDSGFTEGCVLINGLETPAVYADAKKAFDIAVPAELGDFLNGDSQELSQDYVFQFVAANGLSSARYTIKASEAHEGGSVSSESEMDAIDAEEELERKNEEMQQGAEAEAGESPATAAVITEEELAPLLWGTEESRAALAERVAQKKEAVLLGEAVSAGEAEDLDADAAAAVNEELDAESDSLSSAVMSEAEEDEYVQRLEAAEGGEDMAEIEAAEGREAARGETEPALSRGAESLREDTAAAKRGETVGATMVPQVLSVRRVQECTDAVAVLVLHAADCAEVMIGGQRYEVAPCADGSLLVRGLSADILDRIWSGEAGVRVVNRVWLGDRLIEISSLEFRADG